MAPRNFGRVRLWQFSTSDAEVDLALKGLDRQLQGRYERYVRLTSEAADPKMIAFYRDCSVAMASDLSELRAGRAVTKDDKVDLFNRIALESSIEIKYNVAILTDADAKNWTIDDLRDIDWSLARLPIRETVESDKLWLIQKVKEVVVRDGGHAGQFIRGENVIKIADSASTWNVVGETVVHEIGHSRQPSEDEMTAFMRLSGWWRLGPQNDPRMAEFSHGNWVKGKELRAKGITIASAADDDYYRVSKNDGSVYIVPSTPPPGHDPKFVSDYAMSNPAEDFAESFMFYYLHRSKMHVDYENKYDFMYHLLGKEGG